MAETQSVVPPEQFVMATQPVHAFVAPTLQAAHFWPLARVTSGVSQPGYWLTRTEQLPATFVTFAERLAGPLVVVEHE